MAVGATPSGVLQASLPVMTLELQSGVPPNVPCGDIFHLAHFRLVGR
jgi:hypothetical protein